MGGKFGTAPVTVFNPNGASLLQHPKKRGKEKRGGKKKRERRGGKNIWIKYCSRGPVPKVCRPKVTQHFAVRPGNASCKREGEGGRGKKGECRSLLNRRKRAPFARILIAFTALLTTRGKETPRSRKNCSAIRHCICHINAPGAHWGKKKGEGGGGEER